MKSAKSEISQDIRAPYYHKRVREHGQKYPHFHWPSVEVFMSLVYTYHRIEDNVEGLFNQHGLSRAGFNALMIVSRSHSQGCKQQEISKFLLVSRANVSGLIEGLINQGLVVRTEHPSDRRAFIIRTSKKANILLKRLLPKYYKLIRGLLLTLDAAQKSHLKSLLKMVCIKMDHKSRS
ncbi:MAG: MarR family transcriptional regulator [Candidatus Omnitrophota bacterium]